MTENLRPVPWWQIWVNPIFLRYTRSRLRPAPLITWIILVLTLATSIFFLFYYSSLYRLTAGPAAAARDAFYPILFFQMVILLFMGTGSVAGGISRESADGMIDYQRLTPMTPLAKIVGYLFGLPVREYVLFAVTLPFTIFCINAGNIPAGVISEVYGTLFTSAILYHLTGCVAGTIVKRRHFAGRVAQIMVILLYFVLPTFSQLGFVFFEYLTMRPVIIEQFESVRGPIFGGFPSPEKIGEVLLFEWKLNTLNFSLLIQCSLIIIFLSILYRKWRQPTNHLLGKNFSLAVHIWILTLITGNALPIITDKTQFTGGRSERAAELLIEQRAAEKNEINELNTEETIDVLTQSGILASLGIGFLALTFGMITITTPDSDKFTRALRKARKLASDPESSNKESEGKKREIKAPLSADGATGLWHALGFSILTFTAWSIIIQNAPNLVGIDPNKYNPIILRIIPIGLILYAMCYHAILERFGKRTLLLFFILGWFVPPLTSAILGVRGIETIPTLLAGLSAIASPVYLLVLPIVNTSGDDRLMQISGYFSLFSHSALLIFLWWTLFLHKVRIREEVSNQETSS
ncbi:MAG: hypothetical protein MK172_02745 [Verrucomicrobiales bacterium]|nr:hypothetical protein [Verrucomicrobiales bacterium]